MTSLQGVNKQESRSKAACRVPPSASLGTPSPCGSLALPTMNLPAQALSILDTALRVPPLFIMDEILKCCFGFSNNIHARFVTFTCPLVSSSCPQWSPRVALCTCGLPVTLRGYVLCICDVGEVKHSRLIATWLSAGNKNVWGGQNVN